MPVWTILEADPESYNFFANELFDLSAVCSKIEAVDKGPVIMAIVKGPDTLTKTSLSLSNKLF